jgi:hypothetical protein
MFRRARHASVLLASLVLAACGGAADGSSAREPSRADADSGAPESAAAASASQEAGLPEGWSLRLDRAGSDASEVRVAAMDDALEIRTGPAGILWREQDAVTGGAYEVSATFTEVGAPAGHREAYGLFIGGSDLQGEGQAYTYFLVRGDGSFLIKRRAGSGTSDVTDGWRPSDAVAAAGEGDPTNTLSIRVGPEQVQFIVNGTGVATVPAGDVDAHGTAGLRVNHNLQLRIADFSIER